MTDLKSKDSAGPSSEKSASNSLAPLLVKISALAGVAVPLHRFAYPDESEDGLELSKLEPVNQAIELWKIRFPKKYTG